MLDTAEIWDEHDVMQRSQAESKRVMLTACFPPCVRWRVEWASTVKNGRDFCNSMCQVKNFKVLKAFV